MVEPDYDFFAARQQRVHDPDVAPAVPARLAAMPSPGPAPMTAWNPDPVLASAPPHAAGADAAASYPGEAGTAAALRSATLPSVLLIVAVLALLVAAVAGAVSALGHGA